MIRSIVLCIMLFSGIANASTIDIYYPNNNTTTEIYYAEDAGYNSTTNNTLSGDLRIVIIKNTIEYTDVLHNPAQAIPIIAPWLLIMFLCVLFAVMVIYAYRIIK